MHLLRQAGPSKDTAETEQRVVFFGRALHGAEGEPAGEPGNPGAVSSLPEREEMPGKIAMQPEIRQAVCRSIVSRMPGPRRHRPGDWWIQDRQLVHQLAGALR